MFSLYITFHRVIYDEFYKSLTTAQKNSLVFYGVKQRQIPDDNELYVMYEFELPFYEPLLQNLRYNESSAFFHIYHNKLYNNNDFIGFFQYDMYMHTSQIEEIEHICKNVKVPFVIAPFFATPSAKESLGGSIQLLMNSLDTFGNPLDNYNAHFNTNHTLDIVLSQPMIMCNTFVTSIELFEKFMSWLNQFFIKTVNSEQLYYIIAQNPGLLELDAYDVTIPKVDIINPGHLIEILTAMFFALQMYEGCVCYDIGIAHLHDKRVL